MVSSLFTHVKLNCAILLFQFDIGYNVFLLKYYNQSCVNTAGGFHAMQLGNWEIRVSIQGRVNGSVGF